MVKNCFKLWKTAKIRASLKQGAAALYFLVLAAAVSCTSTKKPQIVSIDIEIQKTGKSVPLTIETAVTAAEQQRGFMHRKSIPDGTGMLFIYTSDTRLRFWMKDTPHPLSIAFIDSCGRIREIYDMQPFSLEIIASEHSVRYALEVPQGYFDRSGIGIGDTLSAESLASLKTVNTPSSGQTGL